MLTLTPKGCRFPLTKSQISLQHLPRAPLVHQATAAMRPQAHGLSTPEDTDCTSSLQEEGKQQTRLSKVFCSKATAATPICLPQSWRAASDPRAECGCSSLGPCPDGDFQEESLGVAPFLGGSCYCCRHAWGGGRDTANVKWCGNEEQMCRYLEYPRCYRSAKCYYHGQETGCENPLPSISPCSAPSPGSGANSPPVTPRKTGASLEVPSAAATPGTPWSEGLCRKARSTRETKAQQESSVWSTCGREGFVPCHSVMQSPNTCISVAVWKDVSLHGTHFVVALPKVTHLMSSWRWRVTPLGEH